MTMKKYKKLNKAQWLWIFIAAVLHAPAFVAMALVPSTGAKFVVDFVFVFCHCLLYSLAINYIGCDILLQNT